MRLDSFIEDDREFEKLKDNDEVEVKSNGKEVIFRLKSKEGLNRYRNFLFFAPTNAIRSSSQAEVERFFKSSLEHNVEGLMIKNLREPYKAGLRVGSMSKIKPVKEDLDVVILAAEYGTGKRGGYLSSFIVGIVDNVTEDYLEIGKVSSGVKELEGSNVSLDYLNRKLEPLKLKEESGVVYFRPGVVIQVAYQDIMKSTKYESGFALRFPRIVALREDKGPEEATSMMEVRKFAGEG